MGDLSEESEEVCRQLLNFGGYPVATRELGLTEDVPTEFESDVSNTNYGQTSAVPSGLNPDLNRYLLDPDASLNLSLNEHRPDGKQAGWNNEDEPKENLIGETHA